MKRAEDSLRDLWDHIKHTSIWIIEVPEEEKKKGYEKIFEEIIVFENFPNIYSFVCFSYCSFPLAVNL